MRGRVVVLVLPYVVANFPARCQDCPLRFSSSSRLSEHRTLHTGRTPHSCPSCGVAFRLWTSMKKHSTKCTGTGSTADPGAEAATTAAGEGPGIGGDFRLQYVMLQGGACQ